MQKAYLLLFFLLPGPGLGAQPLFKGPSLYKSETICLTVSAPSGTRNASCRFTLQGRNAGSRYADILTIARGDAREMLGFLSLLNDFAACGGRPAEKPLSDSIKVKKGLSRAGQVRIYRTGRRGFIEVDYPEIQQLLKEFTAWCVKTNTGYRMETHQAMAIYINREANCKASVPVFRQQKTGKLFRP
ncbi:hypothetical protein FACS1894169_12810 [Bacteroidia bacterium]|nr:hypothetical protein FACS1894169_12810 [Bacteroidia bacterium]